MNSKLRPEAFVALSACKVLDQSKKCGSHFECPQSHLRSERAEGPCPDDGLNIGVDQPGLESGVFFPCPA